MTALRSILPTPPDYPALRSYFPIAFLPVVLWLICAIPAGAATIPELLEASGTETFASKFEEAKSGGLPLPSLVEIAAIHTLRTEDENFAKYVLDHAEEAAAQWKDQDAPMTGSVEDFQGICTFIQARQNRNKGEIESYEQNLAKAFLMAPDLAGMLADDLKQFRTNERLKTMKVPLDTTLATVEGGTTTLGTLLQGKKALLLDFWASWCGPCLETLPMLNDKHAKYSPKGIAIAALNTENDASKAAEVREGLNMQPEIPWLVEPESSPYSTLLGVDTIPRIVLLSPEGSVLFSGHPADAGLNVQIEKVAAE